METPTSGQKFTTVGSIYNPHATPLQPPARRGRTIKWPPHLDPALPSSSLPGYSFGAQSDSPPPSITRPPHYSPLQQNYDRAISPSGSPANLGIPIMPAASSLSANAAVLGKHDDANMESQAASDDVIDGDENLQKMSVKSLTNLASYPNPMQKNAQKMLSRARNTPLPNLRDARSDPIVMANLLQSDGAGDHEFQYRYAKASSYSTILSKGLGAPQPLRAGPPGLRQHKLSTFDQAAVNRQRPTVNEDTAVLPPNTLQIASRRYQYSSEGVPIPSSRSGGIASVHAVLSMDKSTIKMGDTLSADEAQQLYYPRGLPANFNHHTSPATPVCHPLQESGLCRARSQDNMDAHRAKIDAFFYAGNEMLNKSIDDAITEKNRREFERTMGITSDYRKESKGKMVNQKFTIQEANAIPTSEHAAPLLSMLFQTLINHPSLSKDSIILPKDHGDD
jgi:hypothetical protein